MPTEHAAGEFRLLCESYALLSDPERRRIYDISRCQQCPGPIGVMIVNLPEYSSKAATPTVEQRRPLSNGELFSLLLLSVTLLLCILLCLGIAWQRGKQLQPLPSWLTIGQTPLDFVLSLESRDVTPNKQVLPELRFAVGFPSQTVLSES